MSISPELKNFEIMNGLSVTNKNAVELRLNLTEEEAGFIVWPTAKAVINYCELLDNEIRYGGKVIFNAVINNGGLKKFESGVEFSYKVDANGVLPTDTIIGNCSIENVKVAVVNGIPTATCLLVFVGKVEKTSQAEYLHSLDGAFCKKNQAESVKIVTKESKNFSLEDQFELDYSVNEVLCQTQTIKVLEVVSSIGCCIIKGELLLDVLYSVGEDNVATLDKKVIPFRFEQDISKVMPDLICLSNLSVNDFNLKVVVDRSVGKSSVMAFGEIKVETVVYENQPLSFVCDAYTLNRELNIGFTSKNLTKILGQRVVEAKVYQSGISKNQKNSRLIAPLFAKIEQSDIVVGNGEVTITGVVEAVVLLSGESGYFVETALVPFSVTEKGFKNLAVIDNQVVCNFSVAESGDTLSVDLNLVFYIIEKEEVKAVFATTVEEGDEKPVNTSAISVYIPKSTDTLWELSKALGVSEEEILAFNGELSFPLSGDERIIIYREIK